MWLWYFLLLCKLISKSHSIHHKTQCYLCLSHLLILLNTTTYTLGCFFHKLGYFHRFMLGCFLMLLPCFQLVLMEYYRCLFLWCGFNFHVNRSIRLALKKIKIKSSCQMMSRCSMGWMWNYWWWIITDRFQCVNRGFHELTIK